MLNRNKIKIKHQAAFTLVELLISSTIMALVIITVYSVFASGITVWKKGSQTSTYERRLRLFSEKLSRELRNTFKFSNILFEGTADEIAFAGLVKQGVGRISYFLNAKNIFCRRQQSYAQSFKKDDWAEPEELIFGISELNFSYCYLDNASGEYKWKPKWVKGEQDTIPVAVKIELIFKAELKPESKFTKTIFIPIGTGEQKIDLNP